MPITNADKQVNRTVISCGDSFQVQLTLTAAPGITENPADIVLILDRSGSMTGAPLENLKLAAREFVAAMDAATDSAADGVIGQGSRIGIVSFSTTATTDVPLTTQVSELNAAIDALDAGGSTNHSDAFTQAVSLFDPASANQKIMIIFTDGNTTVGPDPITVTDAAKAQGIIIYAIGLTGNGGLDVDTLNDWASDPNDRYVFLAPAASDLTELVEALIADIVTPGATAIVINEQLTEHFRITALSAPNVGTASLTDTRTLIWQIPVLGATESETATLTFTAQHIDGTEGVLPVNSSISYDDAEGNVVTFPSPTVTVDCGIDVIAEPCPIPAEIAVDGCTDSIVFDADALALEPVGKILRLNLTLQNVCPNRRVALAVILTQLDDDANEFTRGMKTFTIPAHTSATCRDIQVQCIHFVLPADPELSVPPCAESNYRARFFANYLDSDFTCCPDL